MVNLPAAVLLLVVNYIVIYDFCGSVAKHVFEKSVAKAVAQKEPSPQRCINTGFFGTSKPRETTPTRYLKP